MPKRTIRRKLKSKKTTKSNSFIYFFLVLTVLLVCVSIPSFLDKKTVLHKNALPQTATAENMAGYLETVTNKLIKIENQQNPKVAMNQLKLLLTNNTIANNCHAITHKIGNDAYLKYESVSKALVYYDEMCGSGYIHGIIEQRFAAIKSDSEIYSILPSICAPQNTGMCYHGVGHGFMWYSSDNLPRALSDCDDLVTPYKVNNCYDGVFMENFEGDHDVHPTSYLNAQNPSYPCNQLDAKYKESCYFYSARYYLALYPDKYLQGFSWCRTLENGYQLTCIKGMGSAIMKQNINNPNVVASYCNNTQTNDEKVYCIDGLVSYYLTNYDSYSKGMDMCNTLPVVDQQQCYSSTNNRKTLFPS